MQQFLCRYDRILTLREENTGKTTASKEQGAFVISAESRPKAMMKANARLAAMIDLHSTYHLTSVDCCTA
ncbi:hypothetical protein RYR28_001914 [Edwardsiella piscicida]|uniref:Uncharacterized protein n=2 Tax=Edwardsiella anguillarum TaxID=1821960 RepID=A0A076LMZ7_9GAMM|nr:MULTISPECIES: hypothetical protein [Edwardsiella]AGH74541.1 hypothetical protein ETAC_12100 [Edwardsiella piscicida C07-087]AIJ07069.1 Hypothetical protein ETEE_0596 [Edwardsiella anguillarum ET080813]AKR78454.1 hypothetical protein AAZ33_13265 [Edwardsiella sp. LADL05-105]AOP43772.1 hypothetical protein A9797_12385 [Edwardsiella piscicida]EKS7766541.1 hypothetical protein [Edwardsiella piscicida]